jgi:hypothetical protein
MAGSCRDDQQVIRQGEVRTASIQPWAGKHLGRLVGTAGSKPLALARRRGSAGKLWRCYGQPRNRRNPVPNNHSNKVPNLES